MIHLLKKWWDKGSAHKPHDQGLELTVTRLMVSMMRMDDRIEKSEHDEIIRLICARFSLSGDAAEHLFLEAMQVHDDGPGFKLLAQQINDSYDRAEIAMLLSDIWRVAEADGRIDFYEERYISRLSSLLKVPSSMVRKAKMHMAA